MKKKQLGFQIIIDIIMIALVLCCVLPLLLLIMSSFSDEASLLKYGYSFWPKEFSLAAYSYLWKQGATIFRAYGISILVTIIGTAASLAITALIAYPISRKDYPYRRIVSFLVIVTLLFNGGLVPTYFVYTQLLHIKNTIWGLLVPNLLMSGFNVMIMRSFFAGTIPMAIIESAQIDGAGEFRIFAKIVLPLSMPIMATVGLMVGIAYWDDWYNGMIYISDTKLFSIQNLLNRMLQDIQFLSSNAAVAGQAGSAIASIPSTTVRMAIAVIGSLPIMIVYPFFQKYFEKGITLGAVKG